MEREIQKSNELLVEDSQKLRDDYYYSFHIKHKRKPRKQRPKGCCT